MKEAYAAKESSELSLKQFTLLKTASTLQRERLERAPLSKEARRLIREIEAASVAKLRYLAWAFYGNNQPEHPIHSFPGHMVSRIWETLKARKPEIARPVERNSRQGIASRPTAERRAGSDKRALTAVA